MKIKFIKEYKAFAGTGGSFRIYSSSRQGDVEDVDGEDAQWLIDNGFAEEVKESGWWKPEIDGTYYYVRDTMAMYNEVARYSWYGDEDDEYRYSIGNVFKTEKSARRFIDYLKAVETVRHDEGFMKQSRKIDYTPCGYTVYRSYDKSIITEASDTTVSAGEFYFDTHEHAKASVEAHQPEWQTILNYDWSKGKEDEDEED